jgi:GNAT superfamily N-acetyltransferase
MKDEPIFRPVQLPAHAAICLQFTADAYVCSFGDASRFLSGSHHYLKPAKYLEWLQEKLTSAPASVVHVWLGDEIIGQMELGADRHDPTVGYVHLYYLVPHMRGKGVSRFLDEYACDFLLRAGHSKARLKRNEDKRTRAQLLQKTGVAGVRGKSGRSRSSHYGKATPLVQIPYAQSCAFQARRAIISASAILAERAGDGL